jgi:hypothetical protein
MDANSREVEIERIVLGAIYEAQSDSFFSIKATRLLMLRSDIDKRAKELKDMQPELREKLELVSNQLLEAERLLGDLITYDSKPIDYVPVTKKKK